MLFTLMLKGAYVVSMFTKDTVGNGIEPTPHSLKIVNIDLNGLVELATHLNVECKEFGKLALSKTIREEVENSLTETEDKKVYLVGLCKWKTTAT